MISEDGVLLAVFYDVVRRDLVVYKQRCSRCSKCNCTLARMRQVSLRSRGLVDSWRCGCYLCFVLRCFQPVYHDVVRRDLVVYKQRCSRCSKCHCTLARMRQVSLRSRGLVDSWRCGCYLCFVLRCFQPVYHDVVRRDLVVYKQRCSRCSKCHCTLARMRQVSLRSHGLVDSWRCSITVSCGCYLCFMLRCFQLLVTQCTFLTADVDILENGRCHGS